MVEIGTDLGGRYRLIEVIGHGGMATIWRGRDRQLARDVAVKVLRPQFGRDRDFLARFRQEARAVARLNDPNVVAVHDIGEDAAGPFIVMEYVEGEDLATHLRRSGPLPPRQAARIAREVAKALGAAHAQGIVHRDVKPANVLISTDGRVKVTDFGIARAVSDAKLTLPGTTMGSVHYLAPEQVRGQPATPASDLYQLGIVLYEMLTGRRPWEGDTPGAVAMARLHGPVPGPSDRVAVPPLLDVIARRALALDPADRFESAAAMAAALQAFLVAGSPAAVPSDVVRAAPPTRAGSGETEPGRGPDAAPRGAGSMSGPQPDLGSEPGGTSAWTWLAGLAGLLVLVAVAFVVFRVVTGFSGAPAGAVPVPRLVGLTLEEARAQTDAVGLVLVTTPQETADRPVGTILSQDPPPDTLADRGASIAVTVATGTSTVAVPDLRGRTEADAIAALFAVGLANGSRLETYDPTAAAGTVISQGTVAGAQVAKGTPIDYTVSRGAAPTEPPPPSPSPSAEPTAASVAVGEYRCLTLDDATAQLTAAGFVLGPVDTNPKGEGFDGTWQVQAQLPTPGELREPGAAIRLTLIPPTSACP